MANEFTAGAETLGVDLNKAKPSLTPENKEGVVSEKLPELKLAMKNDDIVKLTDKWEKIWNDSPKKSDWEKQCDENVKYWEGKQFDKPQNDKSRAQVDNALFEALETYLPQVTRRNPEPLVLLDNSEAKADGTVDPKVQQYLQKVKGRLADIADKNRMRLKLKKGARNWALKLLGVAKFGIDLDKNIPTVRIIDPKKMILDPDATIEEDGYTGQRIGERRKMEAAMILKIIGDTPEDAENVEARKAINDKIGKDHDATEIGFVEWWTPEYLCWKMDKTILLKKKNPHWNYNRPGQPVTTVDDFGAETIAPGEEIEGINHFEVPQMPYEFLSIFNLGDQPMDNTSLMGQNLSNQDQINKRNKQIDKNADSMNGGIVVSLARSGLTEAQAKKVTDAIRKGGTVVIPDGAPREAIDRYAAPGLPADIFNDLIDKRARLRDIFGTSGSTAAAIKEEKTVRGKYQIQGADTDRIGGGVSEYLEQWADDWYNWFVQLLYVYDDGFQFIEEGRPPKITISVKEGSLLPKDSATIAGQAMELAIAGKMALVDMYKRMEYANAEELAVNAWLEINAPALLYPNDPRVAQAVQMQAAAAAGQKPPSMSISFKDMPPEGQTQMAAQAGITLTPEQIGADQLKQDERELKKKVVEGSIAATAKPKKDEGGP